MPSSADIQTENQDTETANRRSRKYVPLTDEEIVQFALKKDLNERDQVFLSREVDYRGLEQRVRDAKKEQTRSIYKKPIWKILALILIAAFALSRQMGRLF